MFTCKIPSLDHTEPQGCLCVHRMRLKHLREGETRGSPAPVPPSRTRSLCPMPAVFGAGWVLVPPTDAAQPCGAGRPHPRARARGEGRGASFLPCPQLHAGGFPEPARTPYSPLTLHQLPFPEPRHVPAPPRPRRPPRHRRAACTPSRGVGGRRPGRHPATLIVSQRALRTLTTGSDPRRPGCFPERLPLSATSSGP